MTLFVLASRSPADPWDILVAPWPAELTHHLGSRRFVDYRTLPGDYRAAFRAALAAGPPQSAFLAVCHGSNDGTLSVDKTAFISVTDAALFQRKFCYFVACSAGKKLGEAAMKSGASGFIGFVRPILGIPGVREAEQREALLSGMVAYLGGAGVRRSAQVLKTSIRKAIKRIVKNPRDWQGDALVIGALTFCSNSMTFDEGNADTKV